MQESFSTQTRNKKAWKQWLTIGRLIPLFTIGVAVVVGFLSMFGEVESFQINGIIIFLLGLIATNALTERLSLLEKIIGWLELPYNLSTLRDRSQLPQLSERARSASEIIMTGVSLVSIVNSQYHFIAQRLREGAKLKFLLLDPQSDFLVMWKQTNIAQNTEADIQSALASLQLLLDENKEKRNIEIRLSSIYLPFSAVMADPVSSAGWAIIEYHAYKGTFSDRPHILLNAENDIRWLKFYYSQIISLWKESKEWIGHSEKSLQS